ncbi:MAG: neutral/alkaline non-lysosomal ceramidase N-terminal domain-containing protein [Candidatus Brockarchaeota archaeon]|nr:neutral/alkaline non-lysosomal ceramidase N-terminal domain-containing protein [Candidatus Brockarchaeota archaeon]
MEAGFGWKDITPPLGIRLGGYGHRLGKPSQAIHDRLAVKAIALSAGSEEAVIVGADVLGVYKFFAEGVKEAIRKKTGIGKNGVFFTTTHTHSGPETIVPMWPNTFPYDEDERSMLDRWMASFKEKSVEAAVEALANLSKASASYKTVDLPGLAVNRSYPDGPTDPALSILSFDGAGRQILMNYACHPVNNVDFGISADYPGEASARLAERGIRSVFTTGASGNVNPVKVDREFIPKLGGDLANAALGSIADGAPLPSKSLKVESGKMEVKLRPGPDRAEAEERFREAYDACKDNLQDSECMVRLIYADEEYEISKDGRTAAETVLQAFAIDGEVAFISIPGELFVEIGLRIKDAARRLGYRGAIVAAYSEDYVGYIPVRKAFDLGTYEARLARWSRVTEEAGEQVYAESVEMLKRLRE